MPTRDYFRAEDSEGRRFWIYREGLWGRETMRSPNGLCMASLAERAQLRRAPLTPPVRSRTT